MDAKARLFGVRLARGRSLVLLAALALLLGAAATLPAAPAAAQQAPYVYYAGTTENGRVLIGGALFSAIPPYIFISSGAGGAEVAGASGVHYIQAAEVWEYEGTWQFVTATPWIDCAPYDGGLVYYVSGWDPGTNRYSNAVAVDVCGDVG